MSGEYYFYVPLPKIGIPYKLYRDTTMHLIEWKAWKLRTLLVKQKISFIYKEKIIKNKCMRIEIVFRKE